MSHIMRYFLICIGGLIPIATSANPFGLKGDEVNYCMPMTITVVNKSSYNIQVTGYNTDCTDCHGEVINIPSDTVLTANCNGCSVSMQATDNQDGKHSNNTPGGNLYYSYWADDKQKAQSRYVHYGATNDTENKTCKPHSDFQIDAIPPVDVSTQNGQYSAAVTTFTFKDGGGCGGANSPKDCVGMNVNGR